MTKTLILITLIVLIYLYWRYQQKTITPKTDDIIERKGKNKETFWDAQDFDLDSDNESTNSDHD